MSSNAVEKAHVVLPRYLSPHLPASAVPWHELGLSRAEASAAHLALPVAFHDSLSLPLLRSICAG